MKKYIIIAGSAMVLLAGAAVYAFTTGNCPIGCAATVTCPASAE